MRLASLLLFLLTAAGALEPAASASSEAPADSVAALAGAPPCCRAALDNDLRPIEDVKDPKERALAEIAMKAPASRHAYLGTGRLQELRASVADAEAAGDATALLGARWALGEFLLQAGEIDEAIALLENAEALLGAAGAPPRLRADVLLGLAMAHFRMAERRNCITHHNAESCIFPLAGGAVHVDPAGARKAQQILEKLLETPDDPRSEEARWLLNLSHMALGNWPAGVPAAHVIAPERFASARPMAKLVDVAAPLGLDRYARAGGVVLDDLTGDGLLAVLTSTFDPAKALRLYRAEASGAFTNVTDAAGLSGQLGGLRLVHGDLDDDGLLDVVVLRGGGLGREGEMPNSLLRQVEPGVFRDVTKQAGIEIFAPARAACFADIDRDGDLDLFVGYESEVDAASGKVKYPSKLWRNDGKAKFTDVTEAAGIVSSGACAGAAFGDTDRDGYPELFVSMADAANAFYRNDGDGTFTEMGEALGVTSPRNGRATWFFDWDNDWDLDLFVGRYDPYMTAGVEVAAYYRSGNVPAETSKLYRNDRDAGFTDVTAAVGLNRPASVMSGSSGDLDGDGWLDIYLGTGNEELSALWPNVAWRNDKGLRFEDVTETTGLGHLQKGADVAFADLDDDGDEDILVNTGGFHLDDAFADALFENSFPRKTWTRVVLEGVESNRFGVGATLRIRIQEREKMRYVIRDVGLGSSAGAGSLRQEISLGTAHRIVLLEVHWPSGKYQEFFQPPLNCALFIREGEDLVASYPNPRPFARETP
ncbi:MAG: FG-GAP-like repeat-containing protein [Candidatus Eiseniibacteriota bacterium]